jgi:hypothetical protein
MTEADRTTLFGKFAKARLSKTFSFEAKICKGHSLPFNAVKEHQENSLYLTKHGAFFHKLADSGHQMPLDGVFLYKEDAFVVIFWYQKPGDKRMTIIDIDAWLEEKDKSVRRSITFDRACEIGRLFNL